MQKGSERSGQSHALVSAIRDTWPGGCPATAMAPLALSRSGDRPGASHPRCGFSLLENRTAISTGGEFIEESEAGERHMSFVFIPETSVEAYSARLTRKVKSN